MDFPRLLSIWVVLLSSQDGKIPKSVVETNYLRNIDMLMLSRSGMDKKALLKLLLSGHSASILDFQASHISPRIFTDSAPSVISVFAESPAEIREALMQVAEISRNQTYWWKPPIVLHVKCNQSALPNFLDKNLWSSLRNLIEINTEVFLVATFNSSVSAFEIYFLKEELYIKPVVFRNADEDSRGTVEGSLIERRGDFHETIIKGVTEDDSTLELIARFSYDSNGKLKFMGGVSVSYFELMAYGLNFRIEAVRGKGWITQSPNGSLLGMAEQLNSGEADILIAYSEFLPYRLKQLRLLLPYYNGLVRAFFRQPPPNKIRNVFFHPLKPELWVALLVLWILMIICLRAAYLTKHNWILRSREDKYSYFNYSRKIYKSFELNESEEASGISNWWADDKLIALDAVVWGISSACGQGWYVLPKCGAMKLIMLSGLITYMFSFTAYSAAIVTSLSVVLSPIKSWAELNDSGSGYKVYGDKMLQSSSTVSSSRRKPGDLKSIVFPNETSSMKLLDVMEALKLFAANKPVAVISVRDQFYQIALKSNASTEFLCEAVSQVPIPGWFVKGGMIISKDSPFQNFFNYITIKIQERGLDSRLGQTYHLEYTPKCHKQSWHNLGSHTLGINDVFTAFGILIFAHVSSALIILGEIRWFQRERGSRRKNILNNKFILWRVPFFTQESP